MRLQLVQRVKDVLIASRYTRNKHWTFPQIHNAVTYGHETEVQKKYNDLLTGMSSSLSSLLSRFSEVVRFGMARHVENVVLFRADRPLPAGERKVTCRIPILLQQAGGDH